MPRSHSTRPSSSGSVGTSRAGGQWRRRRADQRRGCGHSSTSWPCRSSACWDFGLATRSSRPARRALSSSPGRGAVSASSCCHGPTGHPLSGATSGRPLTRSGRRGASCWRRRSSRSSMSGGTPPGEVSSSPCRSVFDPQSFRPFWLLAHAETFDRSDPATTASTRIDRLLGTAIAYQDRVREDLQQGVVEALGAVGAAIPQRSADTRFEEALTLVYRILFLLFAESRELVPRHDPIYEGAYAVTSLCRRALSGPRRPGLWEALAAVTSALTARAVARTTWSSGPSTAGSLRAPLRRRLNGRDPRAMWEEWRA